MTSVSLGAVAPQQQHGGGVMCDWGCRRPHMQLKLKGCLWAMGSSESWILSVSKWVGITQNQSVSIILVAQSHVIPWKQYCTCQQNLYTHQDTAAQLQGLRVTPQVQVLELFVALGPCHAQGGQLDGSLQGKNRNWVHVSSYPGSGNLPRQHYQLQSGPGTRGVGVLGNFIEGTEKFRAPEAQDPRQKPSWPESKVCIAFCLLPVTKQVKRIKQRTDMGEIR